MDRDAEQELIEQAEAHELPLDRRSWWIPNEPWWNQPQEPLREWDKVQREYLRRYK
jgi:hypothetical protein